MKLTPSSDAQILEATGRQVISRTVIRKADLSVVERVYFKQIKDSASRAILKTTCPALSHESYAYTFLEQFKICAASLIASKKQTADADA